MAPPFHYPNGCIYWMWDLHNQPAIRNWQSINYRKYYNCKSGRMPTFRSSSDNLYNSWCIRNDNPLAVLIILGYSEGPSNQMAVWYWYSNCDPILY